jgi:hypothetical protein
MIGIAGLLLNPRFQLDKLTYITQGYKPLALWSRPLFWHLFCYFGVCLGVCFGVSCGTSLTLT